MKHMRSLAILLPFAFGALQVGVAQAVTCDLPETVGGGTLGVSSPSPGAGWDVGTGQCNGDFSVIRDAAFPGSGGDGLELGMRAEQRRVGQVNPPAHTGNDYEVQTGDDPGTGGTRAWWNFQQSIAYDGDIDDLDFLTFGVRTDDGPSVPNGPFDMLALRPFIDDRLAPKSTVTYDDIYQTSQNPVFAPWFGVYDMADEGAWTLTLAAGEDGRFTSVSICIHTPNSACLDAPVVYTCAGAAEGGFGPPADQPITAKKAGRTIPLKMTCSDSDGNALTDVDIAAPVVHVSQVDGIGGVIDDDVPVASTGLGDGAAFVFRGNAWRYNLATTGFVDPGLFSITARAENGDLLVNAPVASFHID
jgi:hypothetical protein